jgi:hypothetical protein
MSDENSRHGYDDVLSSVRRIVASETQAAVEAASGKLLLTPALRVESEVDGRTSPADHPEADIAAESDEATPTGLQPDGDDETARDLEFPTLAERIAELEAAVGSDSLEFEPDGSEDQAQHAPDAVVLPLNPAARRSAAGETAEADLVFAVPGDPEAGADEAGKEDAPANGAPEDAAPLPPLGAFRHRGHRPTMPEAPTHDEDEPALLDEMALRDLVAEIVREELQGGLGERITRNVRKLVRAEIQRAFAARDLD